MEGKWDRSALSLFNRLSSPGGLAEERGRHIQLPLLSHSGKGGARDRNSCGGLSLDRSGKGTEAIEGRTSLYSFIRGKAGHIPGSCSFIRQEVSFGWTMRRLSGSRIRWVPAPSERRAGVAVFAHRYPEPRCFRRGEGISLEGYISLPV